MFGRSKRNAVDKIDKNQDSSSAQSVERSAVASLAPPTAPDAISFIGSSLSFVGKIAGKGTLTIFGHVEGKLQASIVQISDGAQVDGNIVAEELTIGGHVKGTIHANRVKLNSTAVVEGDIFHQSIAIEENARFAGKSRPQEITTDTPSHVPAKTPRTRASTNGGRKRKPHPRASNTKVNAHELPAQDGSQELPAHDGSQELLPNGGSPTLLPNDRS